MREGQPKHKSTNEVADATLTINISLLSLYPPQHTSTSFAWYVIIIIIFVFF